MNREKNFKAGIFAIILCSIAGWFIYHSERPEKPLYSLTIKVKYCDGRVEDIKYRNILYPEAFRIYNTNVAVPYLDTEWGSEVRRVLNVCDFKIIEQHRQLKGWRTK